MIAVQVRVRKAMEDGVQKHSWALVTFSLASEAQAAIADAVVRLAQRKSKSRSMHRLQGAKQLGELQFVTSTLACSYVVCSEYVRLRCPFC